MPNKTAKMLLVDAFLSISPQTRKIFHEFLHQRPNSKPQSFCIDCRFPFFDPTKTFEDGAISLTVIPSKIVLSYSSLKFWENFSHLCLKSAGANLHIIRLISEWYAPTGPQRIHKIFRNLGNQLLR